MLKINTMLKFKSFFMQNKRKKIVLSIIIVIFV